MKRSLVVQETSLRLSQEHQSQVHCSLFLFNIHDLIPRDDGPQNPGSAGVTSRFGYCDHFTKPALSRANLSKADWQGKSLGLWVTPALHLEAADERAAHPEEAERGLS